ncbi:MAG: YggS family pyridoxal phosphate enzyme [Acidobacteria bacterium RIFCSPLOWO2_12_FULL_54_10]|nr:MAG: YggS family pyridoxal phosphate enzyme [Acidobacteria bacterium RIFCSPLOWO2_12_FULL_54_10]
MNLIASSAAQSGRDPSSIRLIAVSKTFPVGMIREAYDAGVRDFGENRVQEFMEKLPDLKLPGARFHMIGRLQSNKVRQAIAFDWIHTVDSERLAARLQQAAGEVNKSISVLIEVKLSQEESKTGVEASKVPDLARSIAKLDRLELHGLMGIPPYTSDPEGARHFFRRLRELRDSIQNSGFDEARELSMGMSHDFQVAIEEGATMVRIGSAIFGKRSYTEE